MEIRKLRKLWRDDEGLTTVEYAILLAVLAAGVLGSWQAFGSRAVELSVYSADGCLQALIGQ